MATGLSQTLPVNEGGTGAKTAANARANLGFDGAANVFCGSGTFLPGTISANTDYSFAITAVGARQILLPAVAVGWMNPLESGLVVASAYVSANDTVTVNIRNITASPISPASQECYVAAISGIS